MRVSQLVCLQFFCLSERASERLGGRSNKLRRSLSSASARAAKQSATSAQPRTDREELLKKLLLLRCRPEKQNQGGKDRKERTLKICSKKEGGGLYIYLQQKHLESYLESCRYLQAGKKGYRAARKGEAVALAPEGFVVVPSYLLHPTTVLILVHACGVQLGTL